jgi:DNA-binding MarR family transcriptional regulator
MSRRASEREVAVNQSILRHWLEAVPNDRLAHLVKDATRGLVRSLQMRLVEHGVSFGHWTFLRILWESDGLTQRELSEKAGVMEPTTFAALKAMEKLGYIARRKMPGNRKKVHIHLTPAGAALKARLVPLAEEVNAIAVKGVDPEHIAITRATLLAMIQNLAADELAAAGSPRRLPSTRELSRRIAASAEKRSRT